MTDRQNKQHAAAGTSDVDAQKNKPVDPQNKPVREPTQDPGPAANKPVQGGPNTTDPAAQPDKPAEDAPSGDAGRSSDRDAQGAVDRSPKS